jgi:hypothetical protein
VRFFYDAEFLEDGRTIDLISIGMVAEDGRELYLVNRDAPWRRIRKHEWLMEHVVPHLPQGHGDWRMTKPKRWLVDFDDYRVVAWDRIAARVLQFVGITGPSRKLDQPPEPVELWADHAAYDHVVLAQLWGPMGNLPPGMPMRTNDIAQEAARLGVDLDRLSVAGHRHDALDDARHVAKCWRLLAEPCPRCNHETGRHWPDDQRGKPGCHAKGCLCSFDPHEILLYSRGAL